MDSLLSPSSIEPQVPLNCDLETAWSPDVWNFNGEPPQSVLSFSDESLTSGEEFSSVEFGSARSDSAFRAMNLSEMTPEGFSPLEVQELECITES